MKKALIIYAVFFALTILIPIIVCVAVKNPAENDALVNIFRQCISLPVYYH